MGEVYPSSGMHKFFLLNYIIKFLFLSFFFLMEISTPFSCLCASYNILLYYLSHHQNHLLLVTRVTYWKKKKLIPSHELQKALVFMDF